MTQPVFLNAMRRPARHHPRMSLPQLIRTARKARGLTQVQLAGRMGVSKGAVAHWELEHGSTPSVENMAKLREELQIDVAVEASPSFPHGYEFVESPEKLAWLRLFEAMSESEKLTLTRLVRAALTPPR